VSSATEVACTQSELGSLSFLITGEAIGGKMVIILNRHDILKPPDMSRSINEAMGGMIVPY
jgi:hypothetical protein